MKAIILVLCGLIALSTATGALKHKSHARVGLRQVDPQDLSDVSSDLLDFGVEEVIAAARKDKKVDTGDEWTLQSLSTASQAASGKKSVNYIFRVVLTDNNDSILESTFSINYVPFSGYKSINSYSYQVTNTRIPAIPTPNGAWKDVNINLDDDANTVAQDAVDSVISKGNKDNKIPDGDYTALEATIKSQSMTRGTNYQGTVELHNGKTVDLVITFTAYKDENGKTTVTKSHFKATGVPLNNASYSSDFSVEWLERSYSAVA